MKRYEAIAGELRALIRGGTLGTGAQLPSIRELCRTRMVSPATAVRAYETLESENLIEARARSGYYVSMAATPTPPVRASRPSAGSTRLAVSDLVFETLEATRHREVVPLGSAFPSPTLFPWPKLARYLGGSARRLDPWSTVENLPPGSVQLRRQIAQ